MARKNPDIDIESLTALDPLEWGRGLNERQKNILEVSERLFGEQGYAQTGTAQIAKEAGVTERTLFKHFPSKSELFKQVLLPVLIRFVAPAQFKEIRELTEKDYESYEEFLLAFFRNRLSAFKGNKNKLHILLQEVLSNENFRHQFVQLALKYSLIPNLEMIKRLQKKGLIRNDLHPELILRMQMLAALGYFLVRQLAGATTKGLSEEDEIRQMASLMAMGIARLPQ